MRMCADKSKQSCLQDVNKACARLQLCTNSITITTRMTLFSTRTAIFRAMSSYAPFSPVPKHLPPDPGKVKQLQEFVQGIPKESLLMLTGAGLSTESGIPDYRSEGVGLYARSNRRPIQHKVFMESAQARQSYWARNYVGWPRWQGVQPNIGHKCLSDWERKGKLSYLITQNVDQLHFKAGSGKVVELHGTNSIVACTNCSYRTHRHAFQDVLKQVNTSFTQSVTDSMVRPDGDVDIPDDEVRRFVVPPCPRCGGILKPFIVFFGDSVPPKRVQLIRDLVGKCKGLLVVGSSLQVFSGYRIALQAKDEGKPLAILNIGQTRADHLADVLISARAGEVLPQINVEDDR